MLKFIILVIIIFGAGVIVGAIGMYLLARNSPEHFAKAKAYIDAGYIKVQDTVEKVKK